MELIHIRVMITILATLTAITFILLSYLLHKHSVVILTIEVILLPTIYIIGNYYIEYLLEKKYSSNLEMVESESIRLNEKYFNQTLLVNRLKEEVKNLRKDDTKT